MTTFTTKLAAFAIAAAAFAANPILSNDAVAKPMGGGGMKMGGGGFGGFKPGPVFKAGPVFKPGPIFKGPIKVVKPFPPICKGPGCFPKPPHHGHGHGKFWVLGGITVLASAYEGCGYEYYKWKSTDSGYWHRKYRECRGWE